MFDSKLQRQIMGCFATGVTVVTTKVGDEFFGMTANAVTSLSLDPPLLLVAVSKHAGFHAQLAQGKCFAMNILTEAQLELSNRFASKGPKSFADISLASATTGAPIFEDALAWADCRLHEILPGGDHDIFLGEIVAGAVGVGSPLLYFSGGYRKLAES